MSWLAHSIRIAAILVVAVLLAAPLWAGDDLRLASKEPEPGRQVGKPIAAREPDHPRSVPSLKSQALGPSGDPILMAGANAAQLDAFNRTAASADEWAVLSGGVEMAGPGTFQIVDGSVPAPDSSRRVRTVLVRVEDGLPIDAGVFSDVVLDVLNAPEGWGEIDGVSFARTDDEDEAELVLTLLSWTSGSDLV